MKQPSAPTLYPELPVEDGQNYRLQMITDIEKRLSTERDAGSGKRNVLLALEPEAAAISCMHLTSQQKEDMNNFGDVGQKFLVADLGGKHSTYLHH
ncbi:hypothetical protein ACF0H5_017722 [Mactra antiquata]